MNEWQEKVTFLITVLASTYGRQASPALLEGYLVGLAGLELQEVEQAIGMALRTCKFMPSPAELRELAGEMRPDDAAVLAWEIACEAVSQYGWYRSVRFEDPAITATIRSLGGWQKFCERCGGEEEKWLRKEFLAIYASYRRVGVSPEAALPLAGEFERQNRLMGYERKEDRAFLVQCKGHLTATAVIQSGREDADVRRLIAERV